MGKSNLGKLPCEIGCIIYDLIFDSAPLKLNNVVKLYIHDTPTTPPRVRIRSGHPNQLAITAICREVRDESMDCLFKNATISFEFSSILDQARYLSRRMFAREVAMGLNLLTTWLENTPELWGVVGLEFFVHLHRFRRYPYYEPIRQWLLWDTLPRLLPKVKQPAILSVQCSVMLMDADFCKNYDPGHYSQYGQITVDDLDRTEIRLPLDNVRAALAGARTILSRLEDKVATIASRGMTKEYCSVLGTTGQSWLWRLYVMALVARLRADVEAGIQKAATY